MFADTITIISFIEKRSGNANIYCFITHKGLKIEGKNQDRSEYDILTTG